MNFFTFRTVQQFPVALETLWDFISDPANLATITPESMAFKTLSGDDRKMYAGQIIHYTVRPIAFFKVQWVTEISHVVNREFFVDEQRYGPYEFWHHKHFVKEIPGGVEMEDIIHYKLPFGFLGAMLEPVLVRPKLDEIFQFRKTKLETLFGKL